MRAPGTAFRKASGRSIVAAVLAEAGLPAIRIRRLCNSSRKTPI
jgi:hypothetical protein